MAMVFFFLSIGAFLIMFILPKGEAGSRIALGIGLSLMFLSYALLSALFLFHLGKNGVQTLRRVFSLQERLRRQRLRWSLEKVSWHQRAHAQRSIIERYYKAQRRSLCEIDTRRHLKALGRDIRHKIHQANLHPKVRRITKKAIRRHVRDLDVEGLIMLHDALAKPVTLQNQKAKQTGEALYSLCEGKHE